MVWWDDSEFFFYKFVHKQCLGKFWTVCEISLKEYVDFPHVFNKLVGFFEATFAFDKLVTLSNSIKVACIMIESFRYKHVNCCVKPKDRIAYWRCFRELSNSIGKLKISVAYTKVNARESSVWADTLNFVFVVDTVVKMFVLHGESCNVALKKRLM